MANLQIKGIQEELYKKLKEMAAFENRSVSQQVLFLIKEYLAKKEILRQKKTPAQILLELSGSWEDEKKSEEILSELKKARKDSTKLKKGF